jgi:RimJ/RimL family protein N-acetyltransferase
MTAEFANWSPRPAPGRQVHEGRYVRLEPISAAEHSQALFEAQSVPDGAERMRYLADFPPATREDLLPWFERFERTADPLFFAAVDKSDGRAKGRLALMRIDRANGVVEVGHIYWGPEMAATRMATEAIFLLARHIFDELGYRRFEWKCNDRNVPSRRAARRLGFDYEGVFRQHMIVKGESRDTAWYAMLDRDWPARRAAFEAWLDDDNFDKDGRQKRRLEDCAGRKEDT